MRAALTLAALLAAAWPARADLAPDPTNPASPEDAIAWVAVLAAVAALAAIWWRRRR